MSEPYGDALRTIQEHVGTPIHGALLVVLKHEQELLKETLVDAEGDSVRHAQGGVHALRRLGKIFNPRAPRLSIEGGGYAEI